MKHLVLATALLIAAVQPALAQSTDFGNINTSIDGQIGTKNLDQDLNNLQPKFDTEAKIKTGDIVGGIIGGVIGGVIVAESYDHRHPRPVGEVVCYAQNRRGETFRAIGTFARPTQERAIDKCYNFSRFCRPLGCEGFRGGWNDGWDNDGWDNGGWDRPGYGRPRPW